MSRVREIWLYDPATGLPILVDAAGNLPVRLGDATGLVMKLEANGSVPVTLQDQFSPTAIIPFNRVSNTTTVLNVGVVETSTIDVTTIAGFTAGAFIVIADAVNNRHYIGRQIGAIAGNTVTLDTPLDFAYAAGAAVTNGSTNMAVNGSVITQVFSVRASEPNPALDMIIDVTRLIFVCTTAAKADLSTFGDIAGGIAKGITIRRKGGVINNIFNAKTNAELASVMFDFSIQAAVNPSQGQNGFTGWLTFAGQNKLGVTVRLGPDEDLECLIQDNLSTLTSFSIIAEGSVVQS